MANETERVEYSFEGNVSSLRTATQTAINLLNKYSNSMQRASGTDAFKASQRSTKSMNASINRLTKDVTKMQGKLQGVADVKLPKGSASFKAMESTLTTLNSQMQKLNSTDTVTTKTLTGFKASLENARTSLQATAPQIDKLIASELRFQRVLDTVREKAVRVKSTFDNIRNTAGRVFEPATNKTSKLSSTMEVLRTKMSSAFSPITSKMNVFSGVMDKTSAKMQSFKDRASTTFSRVGQVVKTVSDAFRRTSKSTDDSNSTLNRAASTHRNFENTVNKMATSIKQETKAITNEQSSLSSKIPVVEKSTASHGQLVQMLSNLGNRFKAETSGSKRFSRNLLNLGSTVHLLFRAFSALTGIEVGDWLANAANKSIEYVENLNLFTVAMGNSIDKGLEFVNTMSEIYGMDPSNLYRYAGYFYQLTAAIGMSDTASASLSLSMTKMANDIASLFNVDIATVVDNLASGIQGMSRAVRKYGMDIRATTLQQTALKYGLTEQVETMSEANRMALRYITMMEQVVNATQQTGKDVNGASVQMGDFARTIEQPANQLRIFKEQITQLGRAIGNFIVAPIAKALAYINGFIMALRMAINFIAGIFGILNTNISNINTSGADEAADSISSIGAAAGSAAKALKDLSAPFDELNVLQEQSAGGGGGGGGTLDDVLDPALEAAITNMELSLENIRMKANDIRDTILEFLGFKIEAGEIISWDSGTFEENLINKFPEWTKTIRALFDHWEEIVKGFEAVFESLWKVISKVFDKIGKTFSKYINDDSASDFITTLGDRLEDLADWIDQNSDTFADLIIIFLKLKAALWVFKKLGPIITKIVTLGEAFSGLSSTVLTVIAVVALVAGAIYVLYQNSETFARSFDNLFSDFVKGIKTIGGSLIRMLTTIGGGIASMWKTDIQPTIEALGDTLAPVLDTLGDLWLLISDIISDVCDVITDSWDTVLKPAIENILSIIRSLCDLIQVLWREYIEPVVKKITETVSKLWKNTLKPIFEKVIEIIGKIIEVVSILWNDFLEPLIEWLLEVFGPQFRSVFETAWDGISTVFDSFFGVIDELLDALGGLLDFIAGVFTGDWERAWNGIAEIFKGFANAIISVFEMAINAIIYVLNTAISLITNAVIGMANIFLGIVEGIGSLFGADWDLKIGTGDVEILKIPTIDIPKIGEKPGREHGFDKDSNHTFGTFATGGVVTSPTYALIGEGRYDEAVIPLGDSPQMNDLVQRIADAVDRPDNKPSDSNPIEVRVFIGGDEYDAFTYRAAERGRKKVGAQPVTTGG